MRAKLSFILPIFATMIVMSSCSYNPMTFIYSDDKRIAGESNTFSLGEIEQEVSENTMKVKIDRIEGMETLWNFMAEADIDIELSGEILVKSGKAKLVLIYPDNTLSTIVEKDFISADESEISQTLSIKEGLNRIKVVAAKDTKLELNLSATDGEFRELGFDW